MLLVDEHPVMLADNLVEVVAHRFQEGRVGGQDPPVHVELDGRLRLVNGVDQALHHLHCATRLGLGLLTGRLGLGPRSVRGGQVDRDHKVHVQQGGLHDGPERFRKLRPAIPPRPPGAAGLMVPDDRRHEPVQHQGVAADVPAWLQTDASVGRSDPLHAFHIGAVESAGRDAGPVSGLRGLGPADLALATEEAGDLGISSHLIVEGVETRGQRALDRSLGSGECGLRGGVQSYEGEAFLKGDLVRHRTSRN